MLLKFSKHNFEVGCDEVGRGCLAGPVVAAAVILPENFKNKEINDSKKLSTNKRNYLAALIKDSAICFSIQEISPLVIDDINILNASILAMHHCISNLSIQPDFIAVDGNKFHAYHNIPHQCIIKGDSKYLHIAAASILAKTYRDDLMQELSKIHPSYDWENNKGYPTKKHREAISKYGITSFHRKSFKLYPTPIC